MARTMGEVLPPSFATLFGLAPGAGAAGAASAAPNRGLFIDVGSGYGTLCAAAITEGGFGAAVGIEKYREPLVRCDAMLEAMAAEDRARVAIHHADVADCDLFSVCSLSAPPGTPTLLFTNNLAFPPGVAARHGKQFAALAGAWGGPIVVVTSQPVPALDTDPEATVPLIMNFSDAHAVCVYRFG